MTLTPDTNPGPPEMGAHNFGRFEKGTASAVPRKPVSNAEFTGCGKGDQSVDSGGAALLALRITRLF